MSNDTSQRLTTFADIREYELQGAAVMAQPAGAQRWGAIMELCQRIKDTEPQAFEVAADWIEGKLRDAPIIAYTEPFGKWWFRHYDLNPIRRAGWRGLEAILWNSEADISFYAIKAIGIYVALRAQVPATYAESQPAPQRDRASDTELLTEDERETLERLTPFFDALESQPPVRIQSKGEVQLLNRGSVGSWQFATQALCAFVAKKMGEYLPSGEGYRFMQKLTGIDSHRLSHANRKSGWPIGANIVENLLREYDKQER